MHTYIKVRLAEIDIDENLVRRLGFEAISAEVALPIRLEQGHVLLAMADPADYAAQMTVADALGHFVLPVHAAEEEIRYHADRILGKQTTTTLEEAFMAGRMMAMESGEDFMPAEMPDAPAVRFIDSLLATGVIKRASDIHIEPKGAEMRVRYRLDGHLITYRTANADLLDNIVGRLKVLAGLDISEKRLPQDGHFSKEYGGAPVEFRISTLPTIDGEKAVVRLHFAGRQILTKEDLGFYEDDLAELTNLFTKPHGAIFMTGPTGSGKSTTLSCFLAELNVEGVNIVTVEDPVENPIPGINHVNVDRGGLGFAGALPFILRQDPDIIMIGEIRDEETARIAIQAAITGHVVLSTLHTNDAAGVIERLMDMGVEPYFVSSAVNGVISQRLARRICGNCAEDAVATPTQEAALGLPRKTIVRIAHGCALCGNTGFKGRFAMYEFFVMTDIDRRKMTENPAKFAMELRKRGGIRENALRALKDGRTTADEVIRILGTMDR